MFAALVSLKTQGITARLDVVETPAYSEFVLSFAVMSEFARHLNGCIHFLHPVVCLKTSQHSTNHYLNPINFQSKLMVKMLDIIFKEVS